LFLQLNYNKIQNHHGSGHNQPRILTVRFIENPCFKSVYMKVQYQTSMVGELVRIDLSGEIALNIEAGPWP